MNEEGSVLWVLVADGPMEAWHVLAGLKLGLKDRFGMVLCQARGGVDLYVSPWLVRPTVEEISGLLSPLSSIGRLSWQDSSETGGPISAIIYSAEVDGVIAALRKAFALEVVYQDGLPFDPSLDGPELARMAKAILIHRLDLPEGAALDPFWTAAIAAFAAAYRQKPLLREQVPERWQQFAAGYFVLAARARSDWNASWRRTA